MSAVIHHKRYSSSDYIGFDRGAGAGVELLGDLDELESRTNKTMSRGCNFTWALTDDVLMYAEQIAEAFTADQDSPH